MINPESIQHIWLIDNENNHRFNMFQIYVRWLITRLKNTLISCTFCRTAISFGACASEKKPLGKSVAVKTPTSYLSTYRSEKKSSSRGLDKINLSFVFDHYTETPHGQSQGSNCSPSNPNTEALFIMRSQADPREALKASLAESIMSGCCSHPILFYTLI